MGRAMGRTGTGRSKQDLFLDIVQAALTISAQQTKTSANALRVLASDLESAERVSQLIPAELSAKEAAVEFLACTMAEFADDRASSDYSHPKWTGLPDPANVVDGAGINESLIDGVWQVMDPAWEGLPGDDSNTLKLLAHIRDNGTASMATMMEILPHLGRSAVHRLLKASEAEDGLIRMVGNGSATVWEAKEALRASRPARMRRVQPLEKLEAIPNDELDPDGKLNGFLDDGKRIRTEQQQSERALAVIALALIRRCGVASNAQIQKALPQLDRYRVRRFLNHFRDKGLVQMRGQKSGIVWVATEKLLKSLR